MAKDGVQITELSPAELAEFQNVTQAGSLPLIEKEIGKDFLKKVMNAASEAGK